MNGWGRVVQAFDHEAGGVTETILEQLPTFHPRSGRHALHLAARSAYSVGVEVGLAIALEDPRAAGRLLDFFTTVVQQSDPEAIAGRRRQVATWLAGARIES